MAKTSKVSKRTISLSPEQAAFVDAKVASGDYASVSEVIREGLRVVKARSDEFDHFLRTKGVEAYNEMVLHPERALTIDQAFAELEKHRQTRLASEAAALPMKKAS
jgi:antitoxin ParD1/3/4